MSDATIIFLTSGFTFFLETKVSLEDIKALRDPGKLRAKGCTINSTTNTIYPVKEYSEIDTQYVTHITHISLIDWNIQEYTEGIF